MRGGTLWQKKLYIRLGKERYVRVRNFDPKNVITTVEGPDTFGNFPSLPVEGEKNGP